MNISIVIPVHNRIAFTRTCLESLQNQTVNNFDVIVVDDGSTDGTNEMVKKEFPHVHIIEGDGNFWWSKSVNVGIQFAIQQGAIKIITLNDDTILFQDFVEKMIYWSESNPTALLGAFAYDAATKMPCYGGEIMQWYTAGSKKLLDTLKDVDRHGLHKVTHLPGRGLLIPREVFFKIGYFDDKNFPQRSADHEFTLRAVRNGFPLYCNYDARIFMYPTASGDFENRQSKSLKKYYHHLFHRKGGGNLTEFCMYAIKVAPWYALPFFLVSGLARRIGGYLRDWSKDILKVKDDK